MNFNKFRGSNNFLIWAVLIIIALGFGKSGNPLGINIFNVDNCVDNKRSRRHHRDDYHNTKSICAPNRGIGGLSGLFAGNGLFVLLIIVLLLLCKEEKDVCRDDIVVSKDDEVDEYDEVDEVE